MESKFIAMFKAARRVSTPLIAVSTPDPAATINNVSVNVKNDTPLLRHDIVRGLVPLNDLGKQAMLQELEGIDAMVTTNPPEMLSIIQKLPKKSIVFMLNGNRYLNNDGVVQALWNLRDEFKQDFRQLILLGPAFTLPTELQSDILLLDEPLPTEEELKQIVIDTFKAADLPLPSDEVIAKAVDATTGIAAFPAEQAIAMSLTKDGLDIDSLWERKRKQIDSTKGMSVYRGPENFQSIVGIENAKKFAKALINGKRRIRCVVFIDEIEKHLAGVGAQGTGDTATEMMGALLTEMQDNEYMGLTCVGVPGGGKSLLSKVLGNEAKCPTILFDFSGMKASLVGESGANMRNALKVVKSISKGDALFVCTSNDISALKPELKRRFALGTFFFDLPDSSERDAAWKMYCKKYDVKDAGRPNDEGWTAAEIKQCCFNASNLNMSLKEAAKFIVPVCKSGAEMIQKLRREANGKYISASNEGFFQYEDKAVAAATSRKIEVE